MSTLVRSDEHWLLLISGLGVCLGLVLLGETIAVLVWTQSFSSEFAVGAVTSLLSIGPLVYARRWIERRDLSSDRYRRIAGWCLGASAAFLLLNLVFMLTMPPESLQLAIAWARWAVSLGGGVGLLLGVS
ncbi:hypothetical protein [Halobaculum gomorrense]|uniref:hypothetical protein n=1 Tax=Halobaculum gomorrense TaxID=43928 RepID=UPI00093442BC|nr:hypothetical protein [Halobaculum gomorrense]